MEERRRALKNGMQTTNCCGCDGLHVCSNVPSSCTRHAENDQLHRRRGIVCFCSAAMSESPTLLGGQRLEPHPMLLPVTPQPHHVTEMLDSLGGLRTELPGNHWKRIERASVRNKVARAHAGIRPVTDEDPPEKLELFYEQRDTPIPPPDTNILIDPSLLENPFTTGLERLALDPIISSATSPNKKKRKGAKSKRSAKFYSKNEGEGTRIAVGGGATMPLDQHVFETRQKKYFLLQKNGRVLGDLMNNTHDRRLLESLRDVVVWKIVGRWIKFSLGVLFRGWRGYARRQKEDVKRFEKFFIKDNLKIVRQKWDRWRRHVETILAERNKEHLRESMALMEKRNMTTKRERSELRSMKDEVKLQRSTIETLRKSNRDISEAMRELVKSLDFMRSENKELTKQLSRQQHDASVQ